MPARARIARVHCSSAVGSDRRTPPAPVHRSPRLVRPGRVMLLDDMTRRNLELIEPLRGGEEGGTLLDVLDLSATAMGGRLLRRWILEPLVGAEQIWLRQDAVRDFVDHPELREGLRTSLSAITDLERLAGKLGTGRIAPRDLLGLRRSLGQLPAIRALASDAAAEMVVDLCGGLDCLEEVDDLLGRAIADDPPTALHDGGVIREGWSEQLDDLRRVRDGARDFIAGLQVRERERTGVSTLKVGFNKVFGYYLEVSKAKTDQVPDDYVRKQTLTNAERYFTPELKEWEEKVFGAEDRITHLETELFAEVRSRVGGAVRRLQDSGARLAALDVLSTFAEVATRQGYVRPEVHTGFELEVRGSRHPVVETMMPREEFIPNDLVLTDEGWIVVLTGPNMAGKSTVLRQIGLIQLLAQIGSFVPADSARLPVTDRIFTRVGATDDLSRGQSTFMVEMVETAAILNQAGPRALVVLDEIGRGTSTYDGLSIAWATVEYLHAHNRCRALFATHFHELTALASKLESLRCYHMRIREWREKVVFLYEVSPGAADRSYGIQVARLAGLPDLVLTRAQEVLATLEMDERGSEAARLTDDLPLFSSSVSSAHRPGLQLLLEEVDAIKPDSLSPLEALEVLYKLKASVEQKD